MPFMYHHKFDRPENFADLSELVGTTCALTWSFREFWNGTPYGVYTEASKARFWGFPRDRKVMEYRTQYRWSSTTVFMASRLFSGRWIEPNSLFNNNFHSPVLLDEADNAIVLSAKPLPNIRRKKREYAISDLLRLFLWKNEYLFREFCAIHASGVTDYILRELLDSQDRILISGNCYTKELTIHRYNEDIHILYPCFVALFCQTSSD